MCDTGLKPNKIMFSFRVVGHGWGCIMEIVNLESNKKTTIDWNPKWKDLDDAVWIWMLEHYGSGYIQIWNKERQMFFVTWW